MISRPRREAGLVCNAVYRNTDQLKHRCSLPKDHKAGFRSWHHLEERARDLKTADMKSCPGGHNRLSERAMGAEKECFQVIANKTGAFIGFWKEPMILLRIPRRELPF